MAISKREIDEIRHIMRGLDWYNIRTDILSELLQEYENNHPEVRGLQIVNATGRDQPKQDGG